MRSTRVVSRQRKLDDFIKSELQRLNSRLDATDVRIQRLIGGEVPANPKQFLDTWPEYKNHGHSGDQRFCCISLHFNLCGIQSTFTEAQRAGTPCGAESAIYNVGPHLLFASPLHTKESARSLFKSEEPWELLLSTGMPHKQQKSSTNSMPSLCHAACARTSTPRLRSQRTALPPPRAPPRPRRGVAAHLARLRRRRKPRCRWAGAARHRHCRLEQLFGRFLASNGWRCNGWRWNIDGRQKFYIVMLPSQCLFMSMFRWQDELISCVGHWAQRCPCLKPNLHAFKFS